MKKRFVDLPLFGVIQQFFTPPTFPDNPDKTRQVNGLYRVLLANLIIAVIYSLFTIFIDKAEIVGIIILGVALTATYPLIVCLKRQNIRLSILLFITVFWILIPVILFSSGQLSGIQLSLYIPIVATSLLFLGWQASLVSVAITLVYIISVFIYANFSNMSSPYFLTGIELTVMALVVLLIVFTQLFRIQRKLGATLQNVQEALVEREKAAAILRENEARFRLITSITSDYTFSSQLNADGNLGDELITGAFEKITGYTPEEYKAIGSWKAILHPDDSEKDAQNTRVLNANQRLVNEMRIIKKDGEVRWLRIYVNPVWDEINNRLAGINGAGQDITENKQAEELLQKSEERFRLISSVTSDYTFSTRVNAAGEWRDDLVTGAFEAMTGYTIEEYRVMGPLGLIHPDDIPRFGQDISVTYQNKPMTSEVRMVRKDGEVRWIRVYGKPVWDEVNNRLFSVNGAVQDITQRKQAEESLHKSEERFRLISSITSDYTFSSIVNADGKLEQNQYTGAFEAITGYTPEEYAAIGGWNAILHPEDVAENAWGNRVQPSKKPVINEMRIIKKGGEVRWVRVYTNLIWDEINNRLVGINGAVQDITERKEAEAALAKSEERFRLISSITSDYTFSDSLNPLGKWQSDSLTGAFEAMTGYTPEEYIAVGGWKAILHPDDQTIETQNEALLQTNNPVAYEVRTFKKSGEVRWMRVYSKPIWDEVNNQLVGVNGAVQDITERKQTEELLQESEERFRLISSITSDYTYSTHMNAAGEWQASMLTGAFEAMTGYTPEEYRVSGGWRLLLHPDDAPKLNGGNLLLAQNKPVVNELRIVRKDGEVRWVRIYGKPVWDEVNNRLTGINGAVQDITERKLSEQKLAEREEHFRLVTSLMSDFTYFSRLNEKGEFETEMQTGAIEKITGYTNREFLDPRNWEKFLHPDDKARNDQIMVAALMMNQASNVESRVIKRNGETGWVRIYVSPVWDEVNNRLLGVNGAMQDITERKRAEEALANERKLLRTVIDHMPDNIYVKDRNGGFLLNNLESMRILGAARQEDLIGKTDADFFPPKLAEQWERERQQIMKAGKAELNVEVYTLWSQRNYRWISSNSIPLYNENGVVIGLLGINRDITKSKQIEETLQRTEAFQRALLDATTDAAFLMAQDGSFLTLNKPMAQTTSSTVEELVGKNAFGGMPHEMTQKWRQKFEDVTRTGNPLRWEDTRDNEWWYNSIYPVLSPMGTVDAYAVFIQNITTEKSLAIELQHYATQLETMVENRTAELRYAKEQIEVILNNTRDAIGLAQPNGDMQTRNPAFIRMFGSQVEKAIEGLAWSVRDDDCDSVSNALINIMQHREPQHIEARIAWDEGEKDIELTFIPVQLADKESQPGILINAHDITYLKEIERFKTRFVADAVHDLATPITALSTRLYLLKHTPEKLDIHVQALENQIAHFRDMLMDLRTLSQLDRKQVDLDMQMGDLNKLVMKVFDTYEPVAIEKQQTLKLIMDSNIPQISFDVRQSERVLINLVSNAINYSPTNTTITVETSLKNNEVIFSVTDEGIGMNEEEVLHVFERFYRTDKARKTRSSGTGLGLAIVKEIVELHGGSITVQSQPGVGSTFTVRQPINH